MAKNYIMCTFNFSDASLWTLDQIIKFDLNLMFTLAFSV